MNFAKLATLTTMAAIGLLAASTQAQETTLDGAEIFSKDTVRFGRWEMRMKVAATPGSVSSFFTYHNDSYKGLPEPWREIDIEILGKNGKGFQSNIITGHAAEKAYSERFHTNTADLSQGYHTYELDWTPDSVVWRIDGVRVRKTSAPDEQVVDLRDHAQTYRMNLWASSSEAWVGKLDPAKLPIVQSVNWMTFYKYTPGQGPGGSNFTHSWTDDFTTFDTKRWSKGNWTFEGNMADFSVENAKTSGGYLMLILSSKTGSNAITPPVDPQGSTKPTSVERRLPAASSAFRVSQGALLVDLGPSESTATLTTLDGKTVASVQGTGAARMSAPRGLHVLTVGDRAARVLVP